MLSVTSESLDGNGPALRDALGQLSKALRTGADPSATREAIVKLVDNLDILTEAAANNDKTIREFGGSLRAMSQVIADQQLGEGDTGAKLNQILAKTSELLKENRIPLRNAARDATTVTRTLADYQRELSEFLNLTPTLMNNAYNAIDQINGTIRVHTFADRILFDQQVLKEVCNLANLKDLGCNTGKPQDFGPDFVVTAMLAAMAGGRTEMNAARRIHRQAVTAVVTVLICVLSGCSVGLGQLPLPAPGTSGDGFELKAQFDNALNLPAKAKVRLLGADVGFVESMEVDDYLADVGMRIADGTRLPEGTRAELRSATPLGDVFVALEPPAEPEPGAVLLGDGDVIPLDRTSAGATVEEVLSTAAMLVNGGAIRNLTDIVNGLGESLGDDGHQLGKLVSQSTVLVSSLSARTEEIEAVLGSASRLASTVSARQQTIDSALAAAGPALWTVADNTQSILTTVEQVDRIIRQLGAFPSVKGDRRRWDDGRHQPDRRVAQRSCHGTGSQPRRGQPHPRAHRQTDRRDVGTHGRRDLPVRDRRPRRPESPADPGMRLPDVTDWQQFIGSLSVTLMRLRQHVEPGAPR